VLLSPIESPTLVLNHHDNELEATAMLKAHKHFQNKLCSMELALSEVCTQSQLGNTAVKWLAQVEDNGLFIPVPTLESTEHLDHYLTLFNTAVMADPRRFSE